MSSQAHAQSGTGCNIATGASDSGKSHTPLPVSVLTFLLNAILLHAEMSEQMIIRGQPNFNPLMQSALKGYKNSAVAWLPNMEYANTVGELCIVSCLHCMNSAFFKGALLILRWIFPAIIYA